MSNPKPPCSYDIFISYRSLHRDWAEILANNLSAQGYKVFGHVLLDVKVITVNELANDLG